MVRERKWHRASEPIENVCVGGGTLDVASETGKREREPPNKVCEPLLHVDQDILHY